MSTGTAENMISRRKADWLIPAGLIILSLIPSAAGIIRLISLGDGAEITSDNARFFAAPWSVALHIVSSAIFCLLEAFQFSPGFRRRRPNWHRAAGRVLVLAGIVAALTGVWMTLVHPPASFIGSLPANYDGPFLFGIRLLAGSTMALFFCLGVITVLRRNLPSHHAWMIRGYALGLGAGTEVFTHLPWLLFPSIRGELTRTLFTGAGWAINVAMAEWLISSGRRRPIGLSSEAVGT